MSHTYPEREAEAAHPAQAAWICVVCPLCGSDAPRLVVTDRVRREATGYEFRVVSCERCGMVYVSPRPPAGLFRAEAGGAARTDAARANAPIYASGMRALRRAGLQRGGAILDVGCARGDFLAYAAGRGYDVTGVDINPRLAREARERGFEVHLGDLRELGFRRAFDSITMWDVIEHVADPVGLLASCHDAVRPGGLLLLHTGNALFQIPKARALGALRPRGGPYLIPYQHLLHFSERTARRALEQAGFEQVEVFSAGTLRYRRSMKWLAMRLWNAMGSIPALFGGPLLTSAFAAVGRKPGGTDNPGGSIT